MRIIHYNPAVTGMVKVRSQRGVLIVFFATIVVIFLASLALIYDFGASYLARQGFQASVDRALTSAIHLKWINRDIPVESLIPIAKSTCETNLSRLPFAASFSTLPTCEITVEGTLEDPKMRGRIFGDMGTTFMRLLGTNTLHVWANRTAVFKGGAYPVVPIIIVGSEHADRPGDFDFNGEVTESDLNIVKDIADSEIRDDSGICGDVTSGQGRLGKPPSMVYRNTDLNLNGIVDLEDVNRTLDLVNTSYNLSALPKEEEQDMGIKYALSNFIMELDVNDSRIAVLNSGLHAHDSGRQCVLDYSLLNSFYYTVDNITWDFHGDVIPSQREDHPVPVMENGSYNKINLESTVATDASERSGCSGFFLQGSLLRARTLIANLFSGIGADTIQPQERGRYNVFVIVLHKGIEFSYLWHPLSWTLTPEPEEQNPQIVRPNCNFSRDESWEDSFWSPALGKSGKAFDPDDKRPSCTGKMTYSPDRPGKGGRGQSGSALAIQIADQLRNLDGAEVYSVCTGCSIEGCMWNYSSAPYDACIDQLRYARTEASKRLAYDKDWIGLSQQGGVVFYNTSSSNLIDGEIPTCSAWYDDPYADNPSRPVSFRKTAYDLRSYSGSEIAETFLKILKENQGGRLEG